MKYFAVKANKPCKICGRNHGYLTSRHKIIVADEDGKEFLKSLISSRPTLEIVEVDLAFIDHKGIGTVDVAALFRRGTVIKTNDCGERKEITI